MHNADTASLRFAQALTLQRLEGAAARIGCARNEPTPEAVHDLRVSMRRLLSALACFQGAWGAPQAGRLRKRLKSLMRSAAAVRDRDIAAALACEAGVAASSPMVRDLQHQREHTARKLVELLYRRRYGSFPERWTAGLGLVGRTRSTRPEPGAAWDLRISPAANATRLLPPLARGFLQMGRGLCARSPTLAELHGLRLTGKRLRYTLELFQDCYGPSLQAHLAGLKRIQSCLGALSDAEATEALAKGLELPGDTDARLLLAYLQELRATNMARFRDLWSGEFDSAAAEASWTHALREPTRPNPRPAGPVPGRERGAAHSPPSPGGPPTHRRLPSGRVPRIRPR